MKLLPLTVEQPWIPRRRMQRQPRHFLSWTFRQRTVFALVDGRRNTVQIAWMLSISLMKVMHTLRELQQMDGIVKERPSYG